MRVTYDQTIDALYIRLTDHNVIRTQQVNATFFLDLDENDAVIGIEILNASQSGINPLALEILHTLPKQESNRPDPETMHQGRAARMQALKQKRAKAIRDT